MIQAYSQMFDMSWPEFCLQFLLAQPQIRICSEITCCYSAAATPGAAKNLGVLIEIAARVRTYDRLLGIAHQILHYLLQMFKRLI